jgi:fatty aldehyde decarbonylase
MLSAPAGPSSEVDATRGVWADILSQAVTGELIGMQNYASMAGLFSDTASQIDAVEHANNELSHARAFRRAAEDLGVAIIEDAQAPYWRRIRESFLRQVAARDVTACLIVQEVMLESFAVSMYQAVAEVAEGKLARTFAAISKEEEGHLEHSVTELQDELGRDLSGFEEKVGCLHEEVMTILAEMVAKRDLSGHCGLCHGACIKDSLHHIGLTTPELRGRALNYYLKTLDRIGVRGELSLGWVANLPV